MKIAITGGIGSGKSYVCNMLRKRGIEIFDCDSSAKRLMRNSEKLKQALKQAVGEDAYLDDGRLNKAHISRFLLESEDNAKVINGLVHPAVAEDFMLSGKEWMECAILFESGFDRLVDKVVCVSAPLETRIHRVMNRDNISREQALEWINKQMPQEEIISRSDFCLQNDGKQNLDSQIEEFLSLVSQVKLVDEA